MWKIAIDCRFASLPVGLGTYTRNIVSELVPLLAEHDVSLFVRSTDEAWLSGMPISAKRVVADIDHYSYAEQIALPKLLRDENVDLLFSPHFNVPLRCPVPFVVTIHDLILHRYPNQASLIKQIAYKVLMRHAVQNAVQIIAVSQFTSEEIVSVYGSSVKDRITVTGEGVDASFSQKTSDPVLRKYGIEPGYLLYVGNAKQHKNVPTLLKAYEKSGSVHPLLLVASGPEAKQLSLPKNCTLICNVPSEDLPALYQHASCFVTPSLYEGFCLPILEAMASGCPVIASNTSAIPEISGQNTVLVEPTVERLTRALSDLPQKADSPPPEMTWKTAAQNTATVLLSALHG